MHSVIISEVRFAWDSPRRLLWVCVSTLDGERYRVGVPVAHFATLVFTELRRMGIVCQPEIGEDLATVEGFGSWVRRTARKASRAVKRATSRAAKAVTRTASAAVRQAAPALRKFVAPALKIAATGASLVPGIGSGIAAGLGTAAALSEGQNILKALKKGALSGLPGGPLAQAGAQAALGVASGKRVDRALLAGVRSAVPGGAAGVAAFDTALAVARGTRADHAVLANAQKLARQAPAALAGDVARLVAATGASELDRAAMTAAAHVATAKVFGKGAGSYAPALSGAGLAAWNSANRVASVTDAAQKAVQRARSGTSLPQDAKLLSYTARMTKGLRVVQAASPRSPWARLAKSAVASQPARAAIRTMRR